MIPPTGDVAIVDLGEAVLVDDAIHAARKLVTSTAERSREIGEQKAEQRVMAALQRVSDLVLKPIAPHLKDVKNLIVSPDGALWLAPWAALPFHGEQYLVETFTPRLVVSARDLVRPAASDKLETSAALVLADPNFDAQPVAGQPALNGMEATGKLADFEATFVFDEAGKLTVRVPEGDVIGQGTWKRDGDVVRMETERSEYEGKIVGRFIQGQRRFKEKTNALAEPFTIELPECMPSQVSVNGLPKIRPLSLTRLEGETAASHLKSITGSEAKLLTEANATEAAVKAAARPKALVVATLGFFGTAPKDEAKASDPLTRCGLILAGYNKRGSLPANADGMLSGLEIVVLDLRGTSLVVLTGCDSGLSEPMAADSVVAMRQAFQLAGAQCVLDTLWPIPATETGHLMGRFYDRLASGASRAEVLAAVQREAIRDRRKRNGTAHPYYWAGLELTGRE